MGWFWADSSPSPRPAPSRADATPPPVCRMHIASSPSQMPSQSISISAGEPACPYTGPDGPSPTASTLSKLNLLNYMPSDLSQARAEHQTVRLPTDRTLSSIPKGDATSNWEYPSPQQMYNAMLRKGYTDTPQDAVESMVEVHNFLNEGAWAEIVEWERRFARGLARGWQECSRGEQGSLASASMGANAEEVVQPRLSRFMGRPNDMTPKASVLQMLAWVSPDTFASEPPFDRHDWYVQRKGPDGQTSEIRYVIDYYSGPPEPTGEPVFYLDVRPALDRPSAAVERMMRWGGDVWWKASGGATRERHA